MKTRDGKVCLQVYQTSKTDRITYEACAVATDQYPSTRFRDAPWDTRDTQCFNPLVYISAELSDGLLYISGFYSKSSVVTDLTTEDKMVMRGLGQALMCFFLQQMPSETEVELLASGHLHPEIVNKYTQYSRITPIDVIREELRAETIAWALAEKVHSKINDGAEMPDHQCRSTWVAWKVNEELVSYYKKKFGFRTESAPRLHFNSMELLARVEEIQEKCDPPRAPKRQKIELITEIKT